MEVKATQCAHCLLSLSVDTALASVGVALDFPDSKQADPVVLRERQKLIVVPLFQFI
jgi:hypothetical protein